MNTQETNTATEVQQVPITEQNPLNSTPTPVEFNAQTAPVPPAGNTPTGGAANIVKGLIAKLTALGSGPLIAITIAAVIIIGGLVIAISTSSPKSVFKGAINKAYKVSNIGLKSYEKYLDEYDLTKNAVLVSGDFSLDTNLEDLDGYDLKNISLGFNAGVDYKNELLTVGTQIKGNKEKISLDAQYIEDSMYIKSSLFEEILKIDSEMLDELGVEIDFEEIKESIEEVEKNYDTDPETYEYLVKTIRDALTKALNSEYMEKEKEEIDVLDKEIKVTKNSYVFDEDAIQDMLKVVSEYLLEDEEFAKTFAKASGVEKKQVKELLKQIKKSAKEIEFDEEFALNIYTKGLFNSIVGIGFEVEGDEYISIYTDGKNVEITFDNHEDDEYSAEKVVITIEKDGKGYKVEAKENKEKVLEMDIKEATPETIDMEITAYEDDEKTATISVYFSVKEKKNTYSGEYKLKITEEESKEYMGYSGKYSVTIQDKLDKMSTKKAVSIEELDTEKLTSNIEKIVEKDEALGEILKDTVSELEKEMLDLNYIGMSEITSDKAEKLLTNTKPTVLYIGQTYYSSYSAKDSYTLLSNLKRLQTELEFYSYYVDSNDVSATLESAISGPTTNCGVTNNPSGELEPEIPQVELPTDGEIPKVEIPEVEIPNGDITNCIPTPITYPGIYLIKDGKIQKSFTGTVEYEELKQALATIGIE